MSIEDLRRRQATLEAVRIDLPKWRLGEKVACDDRPIVAVDWSEIFSFITYEPPREETKAADLFAAHYAGLNYLFFGLPCRLVLLPPYALEMKHCVEILETQALAAPLTDSLSEKYSELVRKLSKLLKKYENFSVVLKGDWSAIGSLPDEAWRFLDEVLKEYLPRVYLDVQERTADAMRALSLVLRAEDSGKKRLQTLPALLALSESACRGSVAGWEDWAAEMDLQRPRLERQNRADALALAYLQALHEAYFWRTTPVFFASRSLSMLRIMENHAGEFEPYPRSDHDLDRSIQSSWRPWDYFAELGYYSSMQSSRAGDCSTYVSSIALDLVNRMAKIDQRIAKCRANDPSENNQNVAQTFSDWEMLRGSFDLEGMSHQKHWQKIKNPREYQLVQLLTSVLSAQNWGAFVERRGKLATNILQDISEILDNIPAEATRWASPAAMTTRRQSTITLADIVIDHLDILPLAADYLAEAVHADSPELESELNRLLRAVIGTSNADRGECANRLLIMLNEQRARQALPQPLRDWLIGLALFFRGLYAESLSYLSAWVEGYSSSVSIGLLLATRAFCAEAHRQHARDYELAMRLLLDFPREILTSMADTEALTWHCLKARLLLDWMEPCRENFEIFPKPAGRTGETEILIPMVDCVEACLRKIAIRSDLLRRAANSTLYLAGRYIPENARNFDHADRDRKLGWLTDRSQTFDAIEEWFRKIVEIDTTAAYLHTLGYYSLKLCIITGDITRETDAVQYLKYAETRAAETNNSEMQRVLAEQLEWALNHLEVWR